jgi:O-antigen/teichoic acid export membrane protein
MLCSFCSLITNVSTGYLLFIKMEKNTGRYSFIMVIVFLLNTLLQYYFIVFLKLGAKGAWIARCITAVISLLIIITYHYKYLFVKLNFKKFILPSLRYSMPFIPSAILAWVTSYGDRFVIERFVNLKSLGIYSFLLTISSLTETIYLAIGAALQPFIFDFYVEKDFLKISSLYTFFIVLTICLGAGVTMLGSNLDLIVKNTTYLEAVPYLSIMIVGFCIASLSFIFNLQTIYAHKSKYFLYQSIFILPINIILNLILIPRMGVWGAVIATFVTKLAIALSSRYYAEKSFFVSSNWGYLLPILIYTLLSLMGLFLGYTGYVPFNVSSIFQFVFILALSSVMYYKKIKVLFSQLRQKTKFT